MKREKALTLENWGEYIGINPTNHSSRDKLTGITSLSTNCKTCVSCINLHELGKEQKVKKEELKKSIKNQESRIKRQLVKEPSKRNLAIIEDAGTKRAELIHEINQIRVLVCGYCFANNLLDYKKNIQNPLDKNTEILTSRILEDNEIPFVNRIVFRFESFGDLHNITQAINYILIAKKNKQTTFAWWTKKPSYIKKAMEELNIKELPKNIVVIFSSYYVNEVNTEIVKHFPFINIVFTVFDKYYLEEFPNTEIHCGANQCLSCLKCYRKYNEVVYINELVK